MRNDDLRARLLFVLGTTSIAVAGGIAACGSDSTPAPDAGGSDAHAEAAQGTDGAGAVDAAGGSDGAGDDASSDATYDGNATVRRPFLVRSVPRATPMVARADWKRARAERSLASIGPVDPIDEGGATARALAAAYAKDACEEHASVAAFARFSLLLLAVGAPAELVVASQRAGLDEIEHAKIDFALAARYGAGDVGPGPLDLTHAIEATTLLDLVALTAEEGCVGETLGAALAAEQAATATDPEVKKLLTRIHADEVRHAELAWRFVRWAIETHGDEARDVARAAIERGLAIALASEQRPLAPGVDLATWHAHGRLTCRESRAVVARAIDEVVRPCAATLAGVSVSRATARAPELRPSTLG